MEGDIVGKENIVDNKRHIVAKDIIYFSGHTPTSIFNVFNTEPLPRYLQERGSTTYLTISSYKENYTVTATYIPSDRAFRPSFPTGFMPIDEEFVKKAIIGKFEDSFDDSNEYKMLGAIIYNYFIPPVIRQYIGKSSPANLVIQTSTEHDIPWELAYDGEEFWCIKYNMGRALGTEDETESGEISKSLSGIRIAIISNPEGNLDLYVKLHKQV